MKRRMPRARRGRQTGAVYVETLIVLPIVMFMFFCTWQLMNLLSAGLLVRHAAVAAVRAAAVVGPDSARYYGGQVENDVTGGSRFDQVHEAAWRALKAQPHFKQGGFEVNLSGSFLGKGLIKATVTAEYHCLFAYVNVVC